MEDALDHGALHEPDHPGADHGVGVDPAGVHRLDIVEVVAVETFHDEHASGHERGMRTGDHVAALTEVHEAAGHVEHVLRLEAEVELLGDGLGEQLDQRRRIGECGERQSTHEERGQPRHDLQVLRDHLGHGGALHLHHHPLAGVQRRGVHLGDRSRRQRGALELGEEILERAPQLALDGGAHGVERFGGHLVATLLELVDEFLGEEALTRGDDLGQLDVGRAEMLDGDAQTARQIGAALRLAPGLQVPEPDRGAEMTHDGEGSRTARQPTRGDERGQIVGGEPPDVSDMGPPWHLLGHHDPLRRVGERTDGEVGDGRIGRDCGGSVHRLEVYEWVRRDPQSCRPHSVRPCPAKRPERASSSLRGGTVHGQHPIEV